MKVKGPDGKEVEATVVDFLIKKEDFSEYQLVDGRIVRIKLVVTRILRLEDIKNPDGTQAYLINSTNVLAPLE